MSDDERMTLDGFFETLAETHDAPQQRVSQVQTKLVDVSRVMGREMKRKFVSDLEQFRPLQAALELPGSVMTLGVEPAGVARPRLLDGVQIALERAGIDF